MMFFKHLSKMFTRGFYFLFIFQTLIALGKPSTQCPEETLLQSAFERQKAKRHFEESLKAFRPTSALAYDHSGSWDAHSPQLISNVDALLQANTLAREKFQEADRTFRKELEKYTADQETLEGPPQSPSLYSTYGSYGEPRLMQTCWKPKTSPQTHGLPPFSPLPSPDSTYLPL